MTLVVCRPVEAMDLIAEGVFVSVLAFALCGIWCGTWQWWRGRRP
jgi:hypothetical protein